MMTLRHLEVFHAIMITGSVTRAARMLNVSQPAVTAMLKHAEGRIKLQLFERKGGQLKPTKEAEALFPDVAAVFGRLDAIGRLTQDLAGGRLGSLSLAAAFPVANGFLARAVATFISDHPGARVTLRSLSSPAVLASLMRREVELGVVHFPVTNDDIQTEFLRKWSIGCVLKDDHPLARQSEISIKDLADWPVITYLPQLIFRPLIDQAFSEADLKPNIVVEVSIALTGIVLASHGAGIALVDTMLLKSLTVPGVVSRKLLPNIESQTLLVSIKNESRSLMATAFVEHLKQQIADEEPEAVSVL